MPPDQDDVHNDLAEINTLSLPGGTGAATGPAKCQARMPESHGL